MGFFFKGVVAVAILAGRTSNLSRVAEFDLDGVLTCLATTASVNSGALEEYTDLNDVEPRVALFDFCEAGGRCGFWQAWCFWLLVYLSTWSFWNERPEERLHCFYIYYIIKIKLYKDISDK